jgi:hypothetical protein
MGRRAADEHANFFLLVVFDRISIAMEDIHFMSVI